MPEYMETVKCRVGGSENMFFPGGKRPFVSNTIVLLVVANRVNRKRMTPNQSAFFTNDSVERLISFSNLGQNLVFGRTAQVALTGGIYGLRGILGIWYRGVESRHRDFGIKALIYQIRPQSFCRA
jgi:hypothetical protein